MAELLHFKAIPYFKAKTLCYRKDNYGHTFLKISFANTYEMVVQEIEPRNVQMKTLFRS